MDNEKLADVYICYNAILTDRVRASLESEGIEVMVRDRSMKDFPSAGEAEKILAVPTEKAEQARTFIRGAVSDAVFPDEGRVV